MATRPDDEVFWEALEQPTVEQQNQVIRSLCEGDDAQYARVFELLSAHHKMHSTDSNNSILDRSGDVFDAFSPRETLSEGDSVGPYRLVSILGEGGMRLVYEAHQTSPVSRNVALKLLKP